MLPAIVTIVHQRHDHLRRQREFIAAMNPAPSMHVVVAMGDPMIRQILDETPCVPTHVVEMEVAEDLPLSAARNAGVAHAARRGADTVVLLDVDCLPAPRLALDFDEIFDQLDDEEGPCVVCGHVRYLPDGLSEEDYTVDYLREVGEDHPSRVVPEPGEIIEGDPRLLWSLNIGTTVEDWEFIGGFDERYVGYGGEDTDFGQRLRRAGGTMWWTADGESFHQYHHLNDPPVEHAEAIARNSNLFFHNWGFYPMQGWLAQLEREGHIQMTDDGWRSL